MALFQYPPQSRSDVHLGFVFCCFFFNVSFEQTSEWPVEIQADPFAVKRNVARSVNSQQMYDYILHCLKTTYRYFALPLNTPAANHKMAAQSAKDSCGGKELSQLSIQPQNQREENGPEDSDCLIEEEEEIEEGSDSEGEKEKADLGKSSFSEEEEDEDAEARGRRHLDSFTTEDEEIFPVDEISGEELLSDEEPPDLDTPGSNDDDEEEEELASAVASPPCLPDTVENELPENKRHMPTTKSYQFSKHAFTRGKVGVLFPSIIMTVDVKTTRPYSNVRFLWNNFFLKATKK